MFQVGGSDARECRLLIASDFNTDALQVLGKAIEKHVASRAWRYPEERCSCRQETEVVVRLRVSLAGVPMSGQVAGAFCSPFSYVGRFKILWRRSQVPLPRGPLAAQPEITADHMPAEPPA